MRKLAAYAFVLAMVFGCVTAYGQVTYTFRVLANKGTNKVKRVGSGQEENLKTGATLNAGDQIIASDDAYIGLMHKSGKTTEVRGGGTKNVVDLEKNINTAGTSMTARYGQYVMNKLNEGDEVTNVRLQSNATGAVSRKVGEGAIEVYAPDQADLLGDKAYISWKQHESMEAGDLYVIKIKNIFDEEIFVSETDKTSIELDFSDEELAYDMGLYILNVYKKADMEIVSGDIGIKKVRSNDRVEVQENLALLKNEIAEDSPLNKLIYASFFEENGLILDALAKYEEAIKMSPEVSDFQELKKNFMIRYGLESAEKSEE